MSETYRISSGGDRDLVTKDRAIDPADAMLWQFPLLRLDAETVWDSVFTAAQSLDLKAGGKSFQLASEERGKRQAPRAPDMEVKESGGPQRRGVYIQRGYHQSMDVMPN